jgi:hypothetical protein
LTSAQHSRAAALPHCAIEESLVLFDEAIQETSRLKALGDLKLFAEKLMAAAAA